MSCLSVRCVLLHREIIKLGYEFKVPQLFCNNCCLDVCCALGAEMREGSGEMVQGFLQMSVRKAQQQMAY